MNKLPDSLKSMFTPGTPLCALVYAVLGALIAVLLLSIGFWKTLFIFAFAAIGAVLGGISNKKEAVRGVVDRLFPQQDKPYKVENENKPDKQA